MVLLLDECLGNVGLDGELFAVSCPASLRHLDQPHLRTHYKRTA